MNKYYNRKVKTVDGFIHDSKREARRWNELLLLQRAGHIKDLKRQVKFVLIPAQHEQGTIGKRGGIKQGKLIERELSYIADFVYTDIKTGQMVVEDAKGYKGGTVYALFVIKRKLMLYIHKIQVREI
jgi:hypothetical protein